MPSLVNVQSMWAILIVVVAIWVGGLWVAGYFVDSRVEIFRQSAARRGLGLEGRLVRDFGLRAPRRLEMRQLMDLSRIMLLAGRKESPGAYLARCFGGGMVTAAVLTVADLLPIAFGGQPAVSFVLPLLIGVVIMLAGIADLYTRAARRQLALDRAIAEIPSLLAVLISTRSMPLADAVVMIAKAQQDPILAETLDPAHWRDLIAACPETRPLLAELQAQPSAGSLYMALGTACGSANMRELGIAARRIQETGEPAKGVCLALARSLQDQQLHNSEKLVVRAENLTVLPMVSILLALFAVIGPAIYASMMQGFTS